MRPSPTLLIEQSLILIMSHISCTIHETSVAEDQSWFMGHFCQLSDEVFKVYFDLHQIFLKDHSFPRPKFMKIVHSSALSYNCGHFRYDHYMKTSICEMFMNLFERSTLASTRTSSNGDPVNRIFFIFYQLFDQNPLIQFFRHKFMLIY